MKTVVTHSAGDDVPGPPDRPSVQVAQAFVKRLAEAHDLIITQFAQSAAQRLRATRSAVTRALIRSGLDQLRCVAEQSGQ